MKRFEDEYRKFETEGLKLEEKIIKEIEKEIKKQNKKTLENFNVEEVIEGLSEAQKEKRCLNKDLNGFVSLNESAKQEIGKILEEFDFVVEVEEWTTTDKNNYTTLNIYYKTPKKELKKSWYFKGENLIEKEKYEKNRGEKK